MMVHIVWVKNLVKHFFFFQTEGFTDTSQDGISRKVLTNLTAWHDSSVSSHVLHTWLFTSYSSYELVANCTNSSLTLDSSPISHTHPLQINRHKYIQMIEEITIKFGTELKPTKTSWKSQLYIYNDICIITTIYIQFAY